MSEDTTATLEEQIEEKLSSEEAKAESEVESDTDTEETKVESESEGEEETSEEETKEETKSEVEFDFHDTSASINSLVNNLKSLSPEERSERISKLTREKEIEAVKKAFPDALKEEAAVNKSDVDALRKEVAELQKLANPEQLQKALEIAAKLQATEGLTDSRLKDLMLQEKFGTDADKVSRDPKFTQAYEKYPTLTIQERLALACSLSPVAIELATEDEVKKQVRLKATKTVSKGKQDAEKTEMTAKDVKSLDDFEKMCEAKFN